MNSNHIEALSKLMEAKTLEKEALMMLMPESTRKHMDVIVKEGKAMLLELLLAEQAEEGSKNSPKEKVSKVTID